ncbi:MAG: hypothetical protein EOO44_18375 [Flavobacterium sp.]|nr:MAG: hypothetical protein EOO44_18375 [Flavobacterium sp.]
MKKFLCLFSALTLMLASCSSDDNTSTEKPAQENVLLPKTEKYIYANHPEDNTTVTYTYDGNKITTLTYDDGSKVVFTYTDNLITKAVYAETEAGEIYTSTTTFTYENNKLKSTLKVNSGTSSNKKKTYTYNANGTISTVTILIDPETQEETQDSSSVFTLDSNGNIIKAEFNDFSNTIEYDAKNNPFKSIAGFTSLLDSDVFDKDANSANNITKIIEKSGDVIESTTIYENTYDSDNYLIKSVNGNETYEYTY